MPSLMSRAARVAVCVATAALVSTPASAQLLAAKDGPIVYDLWYQAS